MRIDRFERPIASRVAAAADFVLFQLVWFAAVAAAGAGRLWMGPLPVAALGAFTAARLPAERRGELARSSLALSAIGFAVDSAVQGAGLLRFAGGGDGPWAPLWIVAMWAQMAVALPALAPLPICDAGWMPMERQVGSSGQTVAPKLYLALGISDPLDYLDVLAGERASVELRELVTELLVGETNFYRTPSLFKAFQEAILPGLKDRGQDPPISVWSAGCATGEEAYSIAIAALEWSRGRQDVPVRVRATDMHPGFLDAARKGIYPAQALREVPDRIKAKYFEPLGEGRYRVTDRPDELRLYRRAGLVGAGGEIEQPHPARDRVPSRREHSDVPSLSGHHRGFAIKAAVGIKAGTRRRDRRCGTGGDGERDCCAGPRSEAEETEPAIA